MANKWPLLLPVFFFIIVNTFLFIWRERLERMGISHSVIRAGNLLLFMLFFMSAWFYRSATDKPSSAGFLRPVYAGMMLKLFGCSIAAFAYIYLARPNVNKPALFICMGLYVVYSVIELRTLLKKPA